MKQKANLRSKLRWWICEDALCDGKGHWAQYLLGFIKGLRAAGDDVRIFASRQCSSEIALMLGAECVLPRSIWARMSDGASKWRRLFRIPGHGLATYRAVAGLAGLGVPDIVFVPTILVHHLFGWIPLIKWKLRAAPCKVLLFFPAAPVELRDDGAAHFLSEPTAKLFGVCIRMLAPEVARGKVILGAETREMRRALTDATGVPFTYLPHPVEMTESLARASRSGSEPLDHNPIVFGCYGSSRHEKGSDILQRAIRLILEQNPNVPARFEFQWTDDFNDEKGELVSVDPWLVAHPKVKVIRGHFGVNAYAEQLAKTDVMVLPYRGVYRLRVSRLAIEAIITGMPVVATEQTTLSSQVAEFGAGVQSVESSAESVAKSILDVLGRMQDLHKHASAGVGPARQHFSVETFRDMLLATPGDEGKR